MLSFMLATVAKILNSVLRSLFISIVMLVIALSVITGQFPPDLDRLQRTYTSLQGLTTLSQKIHGQKVTTLPEPDAANLTEDEKDIRKLEALNEKRAELGAHILPTGPARPSSEPAATPKSQDQLERKLRDLQQDLFRLQERVNRLEALAKGDAR